jgi:hypothetical protein
MDQTRQLTEKKLFVKCNFVSMRKSEMKLPGRQCSSPQKYFPQTILQQRFKNIYLELPECSSESGLVRSYRVTDKVPVTLDP